MFNFFRRRRIKKYTDAASVYLAENYSVPLKPSEPKGKFSREIEVTDIKPSSDSKPKQEVLFSERNLQAEDRTDKKQYSFSRRSTNVDHYNASTVTRQLHNFSASGDITATLEALEKNINQTFVGRLLHYINEKGMRDSEVYKAAQVDKRLFSKIVSNYEYKPSKDTAVALALALKLTLDEANDLLSRAGYTFSHSNKRDVIIEYFFREGIYNLIDINEVLYRLDQKTIGRS